MQASPSLIVALVFVTLLTMGVGNVLTGLSTLVTGKLETKIAGLHLSWMLLLLLFLFKGLWDALEILKVEDWTFAEFVYLETGPILAFFASVLIQPDDRMEESLEAYFGIGFRFFVILGLVNLWILGAEPVLHLSFSEASIVNLVVAVACFVMAGSRSLAVHIPATILVGIIYAGQLVKTGAGL